MLVSWIADHLQEELAMKYRSAAIAAMLALAAAPPAVALLLLGDAERGAAIHEERCVACHVSNFGGDGSGVYRREGRIVNSIEGLMGQVERCNQMTNANLDSDQVDDLVAYLNEHHYRFGE